jgi:formylmethanofuran dehydrogenase subunit E-like metal-binding protein
MMEDVTMKKIRGFLILCGVFFVLSCNLQMLNKSGDAIASSYDNWAILGHKASSYAQKALGKSYGLIVLTNAGHAEVNGQSTLAVVDGITRSTPVSIGDKTLLIVHSSVFSPLWFAFYDPSSGKCAYLELIGDAIKGKSDFSSLPLSVFKGPAVERIDAQYVIAHESEFDQKVSQKVFGGNEFRIVTIANAAAMNVPDYVINSVLFHDHYCPGVTSGILIANWAKKNFAPLSGGGYFVQGIDPWCKEDALQIMLNATPGKKGYAVSYASSDNKAKWKDEFKNASTILYRENPSTKQWEGVVLGFSFGQNTGCESIKSPTVLRLCQDIWYLKYLDAPDSLFPNFIPLLFLLGKPPRISLAPA